jgi:Tfp pilus assembly protein PilF
MLLQGMLENFPEYTDCELRLAAIAARGGKRDQALTHLRAVLKQKPGNADALAFMGAVLCNFFSYSIQHCQRSRSPDASAMLNQLSMPKLVGGGQ